MLAFVLSYIKGLLLHNMLAFLSAFFRTACASFQHFQRVCFLARKCHNYAGKFVEDLLNKIVRFLYLDVDNSFESFSHCS